MARLTRRFPRAWRRGQPLTARRLNDAIKFMRQLVDGVDKPRQIRPSAKASAVKVTRFRIKEILSNVLVCRRWNGTEEGEADVYVAKPTELRGSVFQETIDGETFTYVYTDPETATARTSTKVSDSSQESQVLVPAYVVGGEILAVRGIVGGTGAIELVGDEPITAQFQELSARAWTKA